MATTTEKYIYSELFKKAARLKLLPNETQKAREWFRDMAMNRKTVNQDRLFQGSVLTNTPLPGRMFMYVYDAKTKKELPYWDAFPLIFHVNTVADGFYGINLHYLDPALRARLMDALYSTVNNTNYDDSTKLNISYSILKSASNLRYFKPCFKKYLFSHVKSRMIYVEPKEWDIALFLPLQKFQKESAENVWKESSKQVYGSSSVKTKKGKRI